MEKKLDTESRGHHPHSPSSLQSSEACAHFLNEQRDSAASKAGTLQHKAAEDRDLTILDDAEQVAAVERALQIEDRWIETLTEHEHVTAEQVARRAPRVIREKYLPVDKHHVEVDEHGKAWHGLTGGYPDTIILSHSGTRAAVLDWKFGKLIVTPTKDNMQGQAYAAGVFEMFPSVESVVVVFYHPYIEEMGGAVYPLPEYEHTFYRDELPEMVLRVKTFIERKKLALREGLNNSTIPQTPKTGLCTWCANKALCGPLGAKLALTLSKHKEIEVPDVFNPMLLSTPEDFGRAYDIANQFELVAKSVKQRVTDAAVKEGQKVEGYEQAFRKSPTIKDAKELVRIVTEDFGVAEDDVAKVVSIPITKLDDLVKAKAPARKGAEYQRNFRAKAEESGALDTQGGYYYLKKTAPKLLASNAVEEPDIDI